MPSSQYSGLAKEKWPAYDTAQGTDLKTRPKSRNRWAVRGRMKGFGRMSVIASFRSRNQDALHNGNGTWWVWMQKAHQNI